MRVAFIFALCVVGVAANVDILDKDLSADVNGRLLSTLGQANMLETQSQSLVFDKVQGDDSDVDTSGDSTVDRPIQPVSKDEPSSCAQCDPLTGSQDEQKSAAEVAILDDFKEVNRKINETMTKIEIAKKCAGLLEERQKKLTQLTNRWSLLSETEKKEILRNKLIVEESSIEHVHQMSEILGRKVRELEKAQQEIRSKKDLTKEAIKSLDAVPKHEASIIANVTDEAIDTTLKEQLDTLHSAMRKSLEQSNEHIEKLTAEVPGLHAMSFWSNITKQNGGKMASDLVKTLTDTGNTQAFQKFLDTKAANSAADQFNADRDAKLKAKDDSLLELETMKKKLKAEEQAEELKATIRRLKSKLRRKKHKKASEDY